MSSRRILFVLKIPNDGSHESKTSKKRSYVKRETRSGTKFSISASMISTSAWCSKCASCIYKVVLTLPPLLFNTSSRPYFSRFNHVCGHSVLRSSPTSNILQTIIFLKTQDWRYLLWWSVHRSLEKPIHPRHDLCVTRANKFVLGPSFLLSSIPANIYFSKILLANVLWALCSFFPKRDV